MPSKPKMWGSRFAQQADPLMDSFGASIGFDQRMWEADLTGSHSYAQALAEAGILSKEECQAIQNGLDLMAAEWANGGFKVDPTDEDIHTAHERRLRELVGEAAGKLHTGRSRNDQVSTDMRIWLRKQIDELKEYLTATIRLMAALAQSEIEVIMPGFTHLQMAQPTRFSHWLLSHAWALLRDLTRLQQIRSRVNILPLGSGAMAGNPFTVDRQRLAQLLRFDGITYNSMDAVSDRDYVSEFLFCAALSMVHLSQLAEDVIIYSSEPFGFFQLGDGYSTGSSLMPQKKNPDSFELIRGKTGRVTGSLMGLLMTLKGLPRTYNRDLQEDKEPLFDSVETWSQSLQITKGALLSLTLNKERMTEAMDEFMLATDLAEFLVRQGVPFREAHEIVGGLVKHSEQTGQPLTSFSDDLWRSFHPTFANGVRNTMDFTASVESRDVAGGTSRRAVLEQVNELKSRLGNPVAFCPE